ncbi:MAG: hypothetical protein WCK78_14030 [Paludibacter sp.]
MTKYFQGSLILLFSIFLLYSCSLQPRELTAAEQLMETAPDSALHILQKFHYDKYILDKNKAWYGVLLMQALDKKLLPLQPDSMIDFSVQYYEKHSDNLLLAKAYYYKGRSYIRKLQYDQATSYFLKSIDLLEKNDQYFLMGKIYNMLGEMYLIQLDFNTSRKKYILAYESFLKAKKYNFSNYALLDIGRTFSQEKKYLQAKRCFNQAFIIFKDSLGKGAALQEIAINYIASKQYDSSLIFLKKVIQYPYIANNRSIQLQSIAETYYNLHRYDSARYYALLSLNHPHGIILQKECYRILVNASNELGDVVSLKEYMKSYLLSSDTTHNIDVQTRGSVLETIHESKKEVSKSHNWIVSLVLVVLIGGLLVTIAYIQFRKRQEKELTDTKQQHHTEKTTLRKELLQQHRDTLMAKLTTLKEEKSQLKKNLSPTERDNLDRDIYNDVLNYKDKEPFFKQMNTVSNQLITRLQEQYPGLTERELYLVCYQMLNIPIADQMLLLECNQDAYFKMKNRFVKKLPDIKASELSRFIDDMISNTHK